MSISPVTGVDYDPLLATWPDTKVEERFVTTGPNTSRAIIQRALKIWQGGETEDDEVWLPWLRLFQKLGASDKGVQHSLLGLLFLRHEARHHIDFYCTSIGWNFPGVVAGYYLRLQQLLVTKQGTSEAREFMERLRISQRMQQTLIGNIPKMSPNWEDDAIFERSLSYGILRYRRDQTNKRLAIATLQVGKGCEKALSLNAILEVRAAIETCGYLAGRLRASSATEADVIAAIELLLKLTVNTSRDDYWGLLSALLPAKSLNEAAQKLATESRSQLIMAATWYGLHIQPFKQKSDHTCNPTLKFAVALHQILSIDLNSHAPHELDWENILCQLPALSNDVNLATICESSISGLNRLNEVMIGKIFRGLSAQHLNYLSQTAVAGYKKRSNPMQWVDKNGWPIHQDPLTCCPWANTPPDVRKTWSRLIRIQNLLKADDTETTVREIAETLF